MTSGVVDRRGGAFDHARMSQKEKARGFASLHAKGAPLLLYNVWDADSARAVTAAGARAIATSSWAVAAAQGYADCEAIPFDLLVTIHGRIVAATDLPVSADVEGGYATAPQAVAANVARLLAVGVVGINLEDQRVGAGGMYEIAEHCERIRAVRRQADAMRIPLFINARTDLFLQASGAASHRALLGPAKERAAAYGEAGASGLFVPGLLDEELIAELCAASALPVNVMVAGDAVPTMACLTAVGVSRISFGQHPFLRLAAELERQARAVLQA
jgi:2-methylisocitrate lyase-like PEP mutase family enzyme